MALGMVLNVAKRAVTFCGDAPRCSPAIPSVALLSIPSEVLCIWVIEFEQLLLVSKDLDSVTG